MAEAPDQSELRFMCLTYGMEEAAKHPTPAGKFVKVVCVYKSVPRIIEYAAWSGFLVFIGAGAFAPRHGHP
jgi:hypothetical protein